MCSFTSTISNSVRSARRLSIVTNAISRIWNVKRSVRFVRIYSAGHVSASGVIQNRCTIAGMSTVRSRLSSKPWDCCKIAPPKRLAMSKECRTRELVRNVRWYVFVVLFINTHHIIHFISFVRMCRRVNICLAMDATLISALFACSSWMKRTASGRVESTRIRARLHRDKQWRICRHTDWAVQCRFNSIFEFWFLILQNLQMLSGFSFLVFIVVYASSMKKNHSFQLFFLSTFPGTFSFRFSRFFCCFNTSSRNYLFHNGRIQNRKQRKGIQYKQNTQNV